LVAGNEEGGDHETFSVKLSIHNADLLGTIGRTVAPAEGQVCALPANDHVVGIFNRESNVVKIIGSSPELWMILLYFTPDAGGQADLAAGLRVCDKQRLIDQALLPLNGAGRL
jgi:hypothetical protein